MELDPGDRRTDSNQLGKQLPCQISLPAPTESPAFSANLDLGRKILTA
jgi:hypothetical protein